MPKRKCRCREYRAEAEWHRGRVAILQGVLRRLVDLDEGRREAQREYERAVIDARGILYVGGNDER